MELRKDLHKWQKSDRHKLFKRIEVKGLSLSKVINME